MKKKMADQEFRAGGKDSRRGWDWPAIPDSTFTIPTGKAPTATAAVE
jgi:hypothetical protein